MDRIRTREKRSMMPFGEAPQLEKDGWRGARPWTMTRDDFLATDMYQAEDGLIIEVVLPGIDPDKVEVSVMGDTLALQGEIEGPDPEKVTYVAQERSYGRFSRTIQLPQLMSSKVDATMEKGILRIVLARPESERTRKIQINAKKTLES